MDVFQGNVHFFRYKKKGGESQIAVLDGIENLLYAQSTDLQGRNVKKELSICYDKKNMEESDGGNFVHNCCIDCDAAWSCAEGMGRRIGAGRADGNL